MKIKTYEYVAAISIAILTVFCVQNFAYGLNVADRTPQVRDAIVAAAGVNTPAEVTEAHLAAITALDLASKNITTLKIGDFDGLTSLQVLFLSNNQLTDLPAFLFIRYPERAARPPTTVVGTVFNGLTSLQQLYLNNNQLTVLREAVFYGLTSVDTLYLHENTIDSLEMTVSLEKVADRGFGAFRAIAPTAAPFDMRLPIRITNGRILGGATVLTIPQGSVESETFTVIRTPGTNAAVTADIGTFPKLPERHSGYALLKSTDLPLVLIEGSGINTAPVFSEGDTTTRAVAENTASGTNIGAPVAATDADNDPLTYTLGGVDASSFSIIDTTGQLQTRAALDYETKDTYTVRVSVSDGKGGSDSITVTINVTDVPEVPTNNAPVFTDGDTTTRTIAENTASGINIGAPVSATDADNDTLTYSLGGVDASSFSIIDTSGQLQTRAALDYETKNAYTVRVSVSDGKGGTDSITVTITVTDVPETPANSAPVFTAGDTTTRSIAENIASGINIGAPVSATDADNDTLTYSLGGVDASSFSIIDTSGQLQTSAALDYETKNAYTVRVSVSDGNGGSDSITVTINVTDVAENSAPVFTAGTSTTRSIAENTASGINIGAPVSATDADNDTLTYSLGGVDASSFSIIDTSGQLQTRAALDFETKSSYTVRVSVSDGKGGTDSITVTINVTDATENSAPVFTAGTSTTRAVAENTASGVNIGAPVSATDADNDTLTYSLGGVDASSFSIIDTSGQLQTRAALDYETKNAYTVRVSVSDGKGGSDSITVTINVTDVNETPTNNAPVFTAGTSTTRSIAENTVSGTNIGQPISATDADNDTLTYTLGGADASSFSIINTSGQLQTRAALDYETKNAYTVRVSVSDGKGGTDSITVTINVTDVPEVPTNSAPVFTAGTSTTRAVAENTDSGTNIGAPVSATDADNDTLTYSLGGTDAASFSIIDTSGQLQTSASLDYETKNAYTVTIAVSDGKGGTDSITVTINVTDVTELPGGITPVADRTPQVRDAIVAAVPGVNSANNVTAAHLAAIVELGIGDKKIKSLKSGDFSGLTGLKRLYLYINSISDISSLGSLTNLTLLSMYQNSITDVSPLANLTNLTSIAIGTNAISDISSLGSLTKLTVLTAQNNSITDMSVVKKLTNLTGLSLSRNAISDISAVANLTKLTSFTMDNTSISDISAVANLTNLTGLEVGYNSITDISAVANLTKLTLLGLSENSITDISAVENLTALEYLYLLANPIADYGPLRRLKAAINIIEGHPGLYLDITIPAVPNNTAPVFTDGTSTTRSIAENTAADTDIGAAVAATDTDTADTLTYHLGGTDASSFSIVRTSGQLQTNAALDYETKDSYTVTIAVSDGKGGTDSIAVTINVTDVVGAAPSVETPPVIPENTALLTNFPNPFNPETWIPYQLAKPAKVTLTIYNMRGVVVRELKLGHQPAGVYRSRSHAIYWDGRNMFGEKVAAGVYFYTLTADEFTATRKLLIAK